MAKAKRKIKELDKTVDISKPVYLKCRKCGYVWPYYGSKVMELNKGYRVYICCPRCRNSNVNLEKHQVKKEDLK